METPVETSDVWLKDRPGPQPQKEVQETVRAHVAQPTTAPSSRGQLLCFRCRKPGHHIACCPEACPVTIVAVGLQQQLKKTPPKSQEKSRTTQEPCSPMLAGEVETMVRATGVLDTSGSDDEGGLDPMVSTPIQPFIIPVTLTSGK
ncbi:hypothetical protein E2320_001976 [Naja naja]|nr:hypothetical protein E2320_001976 [Naja naja]